MGDQDFTPDEKSMALFTAFVALARTLSITNVLDRSAWLDQLQAGRAFLAENQDSSVKAYDALMDLLADV